MSADGGHWVLLLGRESDAGVNSRMPDLAAATTSDFRLLDGKAQSDRLNVTGDLPAGFTSEQKPALYEILIHRNQAVAVLGLQVEGTDRSDEEFYVGFAKGLRRELPKGMVFVARGQGPVTLPLGQGVERLWSTAADSNHCRTVTIPLCDRRAALLFVEMWSQETDRIAMDDWIKSFKFKHEGPPAVCSLLR
jgi:hypothetical protein